MRKHVGGRHIVESSAGKRATEDSRLPGVRQQREELIQKVKEVEEVLKPEMGEERVVARTRRHLYRRVLAMRILEFDHFENEEAFVRSIVREQMTEAEQLEVA